MSVEPIATTMENFKGSPGAFPVVLKKIMEMPPPNLLEGDDDNDKDKLFTGDNVDLERGSGMGPSAALTPAIWDKTIPYDGETFHLEYMDLEEFLMENGIPTSSSSLDDALNMEIAEKKTEKPTSTTTAPISLLPVLELDQCEEEVVTITLNSADITANTEVVTDKDRLTPETIDPEEIEVNVNFDPDPTDLVLSSVPGGELFNPRKHKFSEEELKPQPMIKKAKKVYVPEDSKDEKYWQRRTKNNVAAKRSRDARRLKENQITVRAAFLERENTALRQEVGELRKDFARSKNVVARYAAKFGDLALLEDQ
ncbi:thyrotroph embryonic factor-like isoform X1 [Coregonus clupeaformis]|uniref:thyrotroph embryonic factor-like isoform X1 n=2 Tax=Coregonus clupeaformis TaxID=59861 RepID=UPI001BE1219A|nr:thyrotroph embryonic factor-like isoform X1 [Coregonus clupeaformis]XP_041714705.1 thyrotroph embryonic factor-like isoform X1 [Coregonus clupeaformis]